MNILQSFISEELIHAIGWTLIHSIWQGALIAIVMSVIFMGIKNKSPKLKYLAANMALLLVLVLAVLTFVDLYQTNPTANNLIYISHSISGGESILHIEKTGSASSISNFINGNLGLITAAWIMGFLFFIIKLIGGIAHLEFLKRSKLEIPAMWNEKLNALKQKINCKQQIELALSASVAVPIVLGAFKPIILLPVGMVNKMNPEEVESILAHELSHIVRKDYLFNMIQSIVESLLYFNPGVWWISAVIRSERENCCDDLAIEMCGDSLTYARALVGVEELYYQTPRLAMGLFKEKKSLLNRVKRILKQPQNKSVLNEKLLVSGMLILGLCFMSLESSIANNNLNQETSSVDLSNIENFIPPPAPPVPPTPPVPPVPSFGNRIAIPLPPAVPKFPKRLKEEKLFNKSNKYPFGTSNAFDNLIKEDFPKKGNWASVAKMLHSKKDTIPAPLGFGIKPGNDSDMHLEVENGKVKELIVDGKIVDESEYDKYIFENDKSLYGKYFHDGNFYTEEIIDNYERAMKEGQKQIEEAMKKSKIQFEDFPELQEDWDELANELMHESEIRSSEILENLHDHMEAFDFESLIDTESINSQIEESLALAEEALADLDLQYLSLSDDLDTIIENTSGDHLRNIKNWLLEDLLRNGHIENVEEYDINISKGEMKVNGKTLSKQERDRYIKEIEKMNEKKWQKKNKLILKKNDSMERSRLKYDGSFNFNWEKN